MSDSQDFQCKIPKIFNYCIVQKTAPKSQKDFGVASNLRHYSLLSKMVMVISFTSWEAPA